MGSSISAITDMLEQEEYEKKIERAKTILNNLKPEHFLAIVEGISEFPRIIREYNMVMGTAMFWVHLNKLEETIKKLT